VHRISKGDLPSTIPVFPLPGALLLPRARLPLHIFEPRYLAMIDDCLKTPQRMIGMVQPRSDDATRGLHKVGCAGRLTSFAETEDGRYMITVTGMSRFRIVEEVEGFTPYRRVEANWDDFAVDIEGSEKDEAFDRTKFLDLLRTYFESEELQTDWESIRDAENEMLVNSLAMLCPFEPEDKQALLEAPTLRERRETLTTLMEFALRSAGSDDRLQ
jgi:Lon protease-like protein